MKKPIATDFTYWHKGSRIKHLVYHATTQVFHAFDTSKGDLGAHFGNQQQVNNIVQNRLSGSPNGGPFIIPVWLSLENPLRLKDVGSFHADGIASQLERKGLLPKGDGKRIEKEIDQDWRLRKHYDPLFIALIKMQGLMALSMPIRLTERVLGTLILYLIVHKLYLRFQMRLMRLLV